MKELMEKIYRPSRKWTDQFLIAGLFAAALAIGGEIVSAVVLKFANTDVLFNRLLGNEDIAAFFTEYLYFFGIWLVVFLVVAIPGGNRPMLKAWGRSGEGNNLKGAAAGALLGFGTNGFCVLMSVLMGDIKLSYQGFDPLVFFSFLAVVFIQSGAEEITDRLYLYQKLRRRYRSPLAAIIINPLIFMSMHVFNDGFTFTAGLEIVAVGIIFSVLVYYYNSLWAAITFHTFWNFTQNILFGLPNSGIVSAYSVFRLEAASANSGLFYDTAFGVEGSIGSTAVLLAVLAVILFINRGKPEKHDYWLTPEEEDKHDLSAE